MAVSPIIDMHCHIASELFFPPSFLNGIVDNLSAKLQSQGSKVSRKLITNLYTSILQDPLCDQLVGEMAEAGVTESVLVLPDFTFALRDSRLTIAEMIDHHKMVMERHPQKFRVLVGVDPRWGGDGVTLFDKAIRSYGFHGLKLYPPCGYTACDRALYPYYEICAERGLPVLLHIGATSPVLGCEEARPIYVDRAAKDFPGVPFILAHGSVHYQDECVMLCTSRPNVFLDVSGFQTQAITRLKPLFQYGITHKILFATDWPIFRLQGKQQDAIGRLSIDSGAFPESMTDEEQGLFFSGNARRIFNFARERPNDGEVAGRPENRGSVIAAR